MGGKREEQTIEGFVQRIAGVCEGREAAGTEETRQEGTVVEQGEACARASGMVFYKLLKDGQVSAGLAMDTRRPGLICLCLKSII